MEQCFQAARTNVSGGIVSFWNYPEVIGIDVVNICSGGGSIQNKKFIHLYFNPIEFYIYVVFAWQLLYIYLHLALISTKESNDLEKLG